jgi:hypothetical protein
MRIAALLLLLAGPVLAAPDEGLFHDGTGSCDAGLIGQPGGPVRITPERIDAARGACVFTAETLISRMDGASLRDALCQSADGSEPFETRLFLSFTDLGVTVVSPRWGTLALGRCVH